MKKLTTFDIEDMNAVELQASTDGVFFTYSKSAWRVMRDGIYLARAHASDSCEWMAGYCVVYAPSASDARALARKYSHMIMKKPVHVIGTGIDLNEGRLTAYANELRKEAKDVFVQRLRCREYSDLSKCMTDGEHLDMERFANSMPDGNELIASESRTREDSLARADRTLKTFDKAGFIQDNFTMRRLTVSTGFPLLDYMLMGLQSRETYLIASGSGQGKTTLCLSMAKSLTENGHPVLMFSMEATFREITAKAMCIGTDYTYTEVLNGIRRIKSPDGKTHSLREMTMPELEDIKTIFTRYEGSQMARLLTVRDTADRDDMGEDISEMQDAMDAWKKRIGDTSERVPVVIVDYLQLISTGDRDEDTFRADNDRIRRLVKMAKERGVILILVSSQNKASIRSGTSSQTDVAGTGQNIYCVSVVLQLKRESAGCSLYILKNRITGDETRWKDGAPVPGTFEPMKYEGGILVENAYEINATSESDGV